MPGYWRLQSKTAKKYKISYACSNHFPGYLAVEASFIFGFDVAVKQRVPEKIGLCMDCCYPAFSMGGNSFNSTEYPNLLNSLFKYALRLASVLLIKNAAPSSLYSHLSLKI